VRIQAKASSARSSERGSRVRSAWALGVAVLCASLLSGTSAALASDTYSPAGEFANGAFSSPGKIAVDSATGNVLVVDSGGNRVQVYDSGGSSATLLTTFGEGELSSPYGIAIDQGSGAVYVSDAGNSRVRRYLTNGAATPTYTLDGGYTSPAQGAEAEAGQIGSFFSPLAIDPGDGDLLIADTGNLHVSRFTSSGAFVSTFNGEGSEGGPFTSLMGLALDAGGDVYVVANGHIDGVTGAPSGSVVERFGPDGEAKERLGEVGALDGAVSIAVAPSNGHVLVATGGGSPGFGAPPALLHVYSDGDLLVTIAYPPQAAESTPAALAVDGAGSGRLYSLSDINGFFNSGARSVQVFKSIIAPELVLNAPTNVTATSVHLSGTVNSDGAINTHYHFDYSLDGGGSWTSTPQGDVGTTKAPQAVEADITGLAPNSKYLVRLVAFNDDISLDSLSTNFTTATSAPGVSTADATDRTSTNATLRGSLNPFGLQTTYHFEYGTSSAYGTRAPAAHEAIAGAGHKSLNVSLTVSGLQPETTYHYRLVADNSAGPEAGLDKTFITEAEGGSAAQRVYELASPEGQAATVLGEIGSKAAADGKGIVFASASPANSPETQTSARAVVYASLRSDQGWVTRALDPRTRGLLAFYTFSTIAVSDDLSHAVVTSDVALTPGAFEGGGNLYLRDVSTGGLTFIAGSADPNVFREFAQGFQADKFLGGSSDFSTVVFNCPIALMPDASEGVMNAYKWSVTGGLRLESKMPDGSAAVSNSQSSNRTGA
jgi:DNA-binding beta-propeller fold protein YncE